MGVFVVDEGLDVVIIRVLVASEHEHHDDDTGTSHEKESESCGTTWDRVPGLEPGVVGSHFGSSGSRSRDRVRPWVWWSFDDEGE